MVLNAAHVHLMVNHYPLYAAFFGVALLVAGMVWSERSLRVVALIVLISAGVLVVVTYVTGSMAEDGLEHVAGVMEGAIDGHEDAAKVTLALMLVTALLAGYALRLELRSRASALLQRAVAVLGLAAFISGGYTALLGGEIHHPEIRATQPAGGAAE